MLRVLGTTLLVASIAGACATRTESDVDVTTEMGTEEAVQDTIIDEALAPLPTWGVLLSSSEGLSVTGEGEVRALTEGTRAMVEIQNAEPDAQHPWHVHSGDCGSNGPIIGDAAAYPVLTVDADGEASADATIDVSLDDDAGYYINIHQSATETGTIVACGELSGTY
ncbi:MAG TPA: CHRD domain-containing protein [Gemmatimonadota bacterium]|nr:CHRD domain-containing protein [Gemmatimonadota bacterium]